MGEARQNLLKEQNAWRWVPNTDGTVIQLYEGTAYHGRVTRTHEMKWHACLWIDQLRDDGTQVFDTKQEAKAVLLALARLGA